MLDAVRHTCQGLPPEGYAYIVGTPTWDGYGFNTNSAVNLFCERAYVTRAQPAQFSGASRAEVHRAAVSGWLPGQDSNLQPCG